MPGTNTPTPDQLSQDKDFMAASSSDQIKYLSSMDSDFAKASPSDQQAYLSHIGSKSGTPITDKTSMSAAPAWRPWNSNIIGDAEGLNDQGRKEHPFMAKVGDIARNAEQLRDIVGPEIALLGGAFMGGGEPEAPINPRYSAADVKAAGITTGRPSISDVIAPNPDIAPRPVQSVPSPKPPQGPSVSDSILLQPEAPSTPNTAMRSPMKNLNDILDQQMGVQKLDQKVPLREQINPSASTEVPIHRNPMEVANGKLIFDAAKGSPSTLNDIHNLTRVEIRQALINSGEDMGQVTISSSKYAGTGAISREVAFNRLLAKGYSPEQILKLAKGGN